MDRKIKIAHLYGTMHQSGGIERVIHSLLKGLNHELFSQRLFLLRRLKADYEFNLKNFAVFPPKKELKVKRLFTMLPDGVFQEAVRRTWLCAAILRSRPDILHIHRGTDASHALIAAFCQKAGIKVIRTVHTDPRIKRKEVRMPFMGYLRKHVDQWVVLTPSHADSLIKTYDIPKENIDVIPNGIDIERFRRLRFTRKAMRNELELNDDITLLSVGRLDLKEKDYFTLLGGFRLALDHNPSLRLLIAGDGSGRNELSRKITKLGLQSNVTLLGHRDDVPELMAAADIFVFITHCEGFGIAAAEAMLAGLPVIASDVQGLRYVCNKGRAGWLIQPREAEELACAILELIGQQCLRDEFVRAGRQRAEKEFDENVMLRRYENLYLRI